jgi:2-iminobutanoate/2-iminopropanoate deaminase
MRAARYFLILCLGFSCSEAPPRPATETLSADPTAERSVIPSLFSDQVIPGAIFAGETLYLSGQSDANPATGDHSSDVAASTHQAMDNAQAVLSAAGLDVTHLVSCRLLLADMDDYPLVNSAYSSYFAEGQYPARTTVEAVELAAGGNIEVTCIAYRDSAATEVVRPPADEIPPAMGPYSPGVMAGNTLYLSGQGGRDPLTNQLSESSSVQTDRTLETIRTTLAAAGLSMDSVVSASSYVPDAANLGAIQSRLSAAFEAGAAPAHADVPVGRLPGDIAVEITVVAARGRYSVTRLHSVGESTDAASSPAVLVEDTLYLEAIAAPESGDSLADQFRVIMARHEAKLSLADMSASNAVYADVLLRDLDDRSALVELMGQYFPGTPPAATIIGVGKDSEATVTIGLIAAR